MGLETRESRVDAVNIVMFLIVDMLVAARSGLPKMAYETLHIILSLAFCPCDSASHSIHLNTAF
jgi:hypothetical protein